MRRILSNGPWGFYTQICDFIAGVGIFLFAVKVLKVYRAEIALSGPEFACRTDLTRGVSLRLSFLK